MVTLAFGSMHSQWGFITVNYERANDEIDASNIMNDVELVGLVISDESW